jgi:hypothetical protein
MLPKPPRGQRSLPFQTKEEALADLYERVVSMGERLVRIESKLSKMCLAMGLDENGRPLKPKPSRLPQDRPRTLVTTD